MTEDDVPEFLGTAQMPSIYLLRAAVHVLAQLEEGGSVALDTRTGYRQYASGALFPPKELALAESFLIGVGWLTEEDGYLRVAADPSALTNLPERVALQILLLDAWKCWGFPTWLLSEAFEVPQEARRQLSELLTDPDEREAFLLSIGRKFDAEANRRLGDLGEIYVTNELRAELGGLGRQDLASAVRRVSLVSDQLGYDVVAPRVDGRLRRLEVKTSRRVGDGLVQFFLSRNEIDVGLRDRDWSLAVCSLGAGEEVNTLGWCRASELGAYLPDDAPGGSWRVVDLLVPLGVLREGLPAAV